MNNFILLCDLYDGGYTDDYDVAYDQGFVFYDEEELDDLNEGFDDGDDNDDDDDVVEEFDIVLDCPGKDEIGIA